MKRTKIERCISFAVLTVCLLKVISYGSTKNTNAAPSVPMASRPRLATPTNHQSPTTNNLLSTWTARGAYCDWQPIDLPDTFRFPVGTNIVDAITLLAWGEITIPPPLITQRSSFNTSLAALPTRVSLEPGVSSVTHGLTPSNSYLIAWQNACVERSATNRVNAAIELFPDGSVTTIWQPLNPNQQPTTNHQQPVPPPGFPGHGQDPAWIRATFPDEADAILAQGYANWLLNDYVGINAENGHALIRVTIDPSAFNQPPTINNQQPIYLACGRYRVNVAEPGTYAFPLEVLTSCEVRTYPTPITLAFDFDDGYRGDNGPSFEVADLNHPAPKPRLLMATSSGPSDSIYRLVMTPHIVITPHSIALATAVGEELRFWCNTASRAYTFIAEDDGVTLSIDGARAVIRDAWIAGFYEVHNSAYDEAVAGYFELYGNSPTNDNGYVTNRVDATIFFGQSWHTESLGNRRTSHHLTAVTRQGSTEPVTVAHTHAMAEGQSAYVAVYMASTEPDSNPAYDDSVSWSVTSNSGGGLIGSASVMERWEALAGATSWETNSTASSTILFFFAASSSPRHSTMCCDSRSRPRRRTPPTAFAKPAFRSSSIPSTQTVTSSACRLGLNDARIRPARPVVSAWAARWCSRGRRLAGHS